jgi:5-methylcytosine-specific restriction endonuclease McrA
MPTTERTKTCKRCKRNLPVSVGFHTYKKKSPYSDKIYICLYSDCRECRAERCKIWRDKNHDSIVLYKQTDKVRTRHRLDSQIRYYMEKSAPGVFTKEQIDARIEYFGGRCWICRGPYDTMDHVIPIARGGTNWASNQRPICTICNSRKGARIVHKGDSIQKTSVL